MADLADALGREVELTALAIDEALILQSLQGLLQSHHVARRVITEVASNGLDVHLGQSLGGVGVAEELLQALQLTELFGDGSGVGEGRAVIAAHPVRATPVDVGRRHAQVLSLIHI